MTKIPCDECICLPVCKSKQIKYMFEQCQLIMTHCRDSIDDADHSGVGMSMFKLAEAVNKVHNRYFVPCFTSLGSDGDSLERIGLIDIDPDNYDHSHQIRLEKTYRIFKRAYNVDLLNMRRVKTYLAALITIEG